jgi:plastocyanin
MTARTWGIFCSAMVLAGALLAPSAGQQKPAPVVIRITANGKYVEKTKGQPTDPVEVKVNQSVRWSNEDSEAHTATSTLIDPKSKDPLFDTKKIRGDEESDLITFTPAMYKRAVTLTNGKLGDPVVIPYFCTYHPKDMKGKIKLLPK